MADIDAVGRLIIASVNNLTSNYLVSLQIELVLFSKNIFIGAEIQLPDG